MMKKEAPQRQQRNLSYRENMLRRANARDEVLFPKKIWQDIVTEVDSQAVQEEQTRAASNWRLESSLFDLEHHSQSIYPKTGFQ
jgi:hypothetical protein